jgi:ABC-type Zn uptake system ZnuABC Zn-binding protein ZnuA
MENESALASYHDFGAELSPLPGEEHEEVQGHEHDGNPHAWWLLPSNAIAISNATREALTILDSTYSEFWEASFDAFVEDVMAFESLVNEMDDTYHFSDMKAVVVFPAEAYVAEAFGIEPVAYLQEESVQISGIQLVEVQDALRNGSVQLILGSDVAKLQTAGIFAEQLVEDYGGTLIWVRAVFFSGLSDYISVMTYNLGSMTSGLDGQMSSPIDTGATLIWMGATGVLAVIFIIQTVLLVQRARAE